MNLNALFRVVVIGTLCLLCVPVFAAQSSERESKTLLASWAGKDIAKLSGNKQEQFQKFVNQNLLSSSDTKYFACSPAYIFINEGHAYVWKFGGSSHNTHLIYLNPHTGLVPSSEHAWLFIVNEKGKILSRSDFDTGWRMYSNGASLTRVNWMASPVLIQEMKVGMNGNGPRKIYMGFDGLRPAVVRIEDQKGDWHRMDFRPNWVVGPEFKDLSKTTMLRALTGTNEVRRLEALVRLSGNIDPLGGRLGTDSRTKRGEALNNQLGRDSDIGKAVRQLRLSSNKYVQQLAKATPMFDSR